MAFTKDWRPDDWEQRKANIVRETGVEFSPSTGYSKEDKDKFIEAAATSVLGALAASIVNPIEG
ncbi:hypothetical protein LCGC14_0868570 [marine sediment metagenome]|uniref:Uncharacterized protein n=1 Tax=marine sediment metagenome TaxID=412755 RepID=A0A0F9PA64_9ZZZZ